MLHKISEMICTVCNEPLGENAAGIFGVEHNGTLRFGWSCCHSPVGDIAVFFGSQACSDAWLVEHPEYSEILHQLIAEHENQKAAR